MIVISKITLENISEYEYWKSPKHKYHTLNGPYFSKSSEKTIKTEIEELKLKLETNQEVLPNKRVISNKKNELIGEVSWYWKSEETNWMEVGIVIFNDKFWGKGIGFQALTKWIDIVFREHVQIVRLGITTWSGNFGMLKLAEKVGMQKEAEYRKARIVEGKYYDSVSYGILREEWNSMKEELEK